jgi:hypothetical protein
MTESELFDDVQKTVEKLNFLLVDYSDISQKENPNYFVNESLNKKFGEKMYRVIELETGKIIIDFSTIQSIYNILHSPVRYF